RSLTLSRLGKIDSILLPGGFFSPEGILRSPDGANDPPFESVLLFPSGVLESDAKSDAGIGSDSASSVRRAGAVQILGVDPGFWDLDVSGVRPAEMPGDDTVVLNQAAADELAVVVGDLVTVRLPIESAVPADSPLGRRESETEGLPRMEVVAIVPNEGLGQFSLMPSQTVPQIAFMSRALIGEVLDRDGQANAIFSSVPLDPQDLNLDLQDLGLSLRRIVALDPSTGSDEPPVFDYFSLASERLLLEDDVVRAVEKAFAMDVLPSMTYLANAIEKLDKDGAVVASVPYSIITAIDSSAALPLDYRSELTSSDDDSDEGVPDDRSVVPVVINDWTADRLGASPGTRLRIAYFEPEVERGREVERYFQVVVTAIVPITEPTTPYRPNRVAVFEDAPTVYNDPDLTPTVPGVTDQDSISDWDMPFPLTRKIEREDDLYWNNHRLTPKVFMPLSDGRRLFGSRFGSTTGLRIDRSSAENLDGLTERVGLIVDPIVGELGWEPIRIRHEQLAASRGTTPFDALFLSLSFFVIAAAVLLIAMLFRLGVQERLREMGTLLAIGWTQKQVSRLILGEGLWLAAVGSLVGVLGGLLYAFVVLSALRTSWVGAVTVPFLSFHWTWTSLLVGGVSGWLVSAITLAWTVRSVSKTTASNLLAGRDSDDSLAATTSKRKGNRSRRVRWFSVAMVVVAMIVAVAGATAGGIAAAGGFVGGGMLLLVAALSWVYGRLVGRVLTASSEHSRNFNPMHRAANSLQQTRLSMTALAATNATRNPIRSTLTIGLMSTAAFLIIAMTAFQLRPTEAGIGGYDLIGASAQPLYRDLSDSSVRSEWFAQDEARLQDVEIAAIRRRLGQDASCNNLYQATTPTVWGVGASFGSSQSEEADPNGAGSRFEWAAHGDVVGNESVWTLLQSSGDGSMDRPIPVVIDQNTAMWSLQMRGGIGEIRSFRYDDRDTHFQVVGLLANSVLQGKLIVSEANFQVLFPSISGYQAFMFDVPNDKLSEVTSVLENRLGDLGMDVTDSRSVLSGMLAVQNTYLRTFQSLGALGLLLGTVGLAVSQLRSVLERRRELAVLRSIGFSRSQLAVMVMGETATLLLVGIGCGALCAFAAVLPYGYISGLRPPVVEPAMVILGIIGFGLLAGLIAVVRVVRMPLLDSLRGA
ncbi:MAG: FtsX-like permease family protein, partial [Planctomycetota bacterium]